MVDLISVIIPNYNHARFLNQRIDSILNQTYQNFEIIILDDCSTDESRSIIGSYKNHPKVSHTIFNTINSGSTFIQWEKGINLSAGNYIWIAESDDYSSSDFLQSLVNLIDENVNVGLAYCGSETVDENGKKIGNLIHEVINNKNNYDNYIAYFPRCLNYFRQSNTSVSRSDFYRKDNYKTFLIEKLKVSLYAYEKVKHQISFKQKNKYFDVYLFSILLESSRKRISLNRKEIIYLTKSLLYLSPTCLLVLFKSVTDVCLFGFRKVIRSFTQKTMVKTA
ncbi:MAG: glycosyltransferase family 2 protein [Sphingobacteriaceae bacterium]|nr:MAG: glycosyltransferase family 2 protein [Sphingobacteriaceae bacterium]